MYLLMASNAQRTSTEKCEGSYEGCSSGRYHLVALGVFIGELGRSSVKLVTSRGVVSKARIRGEYPTSVIHAWKIV